MKYAPTLLLPTLIHVLLFVVPAGAQTSTTRPVGLGIERLDLGTGLPGLAIQDIEVSDDGLLWVTASGRLASFDGSVFEEHLAAEPLAWTGGRIVAVGEGAGDTILVTAGRRLFTYADGALALRAESEHILRDVWMDESGRVWAWADPGALLLGDAGFERVVTLASRWQWGQVADVPGDPAAVERGAMLLDRGRGAMRRIDARALRDTLPFPEGWPVPLAGMILQRRIDGELHLSHPEGAWRRILPPGFASRPLLVDGRGLFWASRRGFVDALDEDGGLVASLPLEPDARVQAVHEDAEGNLWFGTALHGLYRVRRLPVRGLGAAEGLTDRQIMHVSAGGDGAVLALEDRGRLFRVGAGGLDTLYEASPPRGSISSALVDRSGTLWAVHSESVLLRRTPPADWDSVMPLPGPAVEIVQDPTDDGTFWIGGSNVYEVRPRTVGEPEVDGPILPDPWRVRDLLPDEEGGLWVAGPAGVARITEGGVEEFLATDGYPTAGTRALHLDARGTLWIGRYGGGLVRYRAGRFDQVGSSDGLWDDIVSSIVEDDEGNLWMGSNRGIHRVARSEVNAFMDGRLDRVRGRGYGPSDGFRNPEASGWPAHRTSDGRLWFPTFSGLAVLDPSVALTLDRRAPGVRLRWLRADGDSLPVDTSVVELPPGRRRLDIAFGAIALSGHRGMRYEVALEGVDPGWVDLGEQRQVTYGSLPHGRRTFRVRAINGAGVPSASTASIVLDVPPYFHETGGFYLLLALVAAGALTLAYRVRVRQLRRREERLRGLVDERTRELASSQAATERALATVEDQARELRSLDESKSRFFANVSHELRTPLTLVQGPLQDVLDGRLGPTPDAVRDQVELVLASGRRLGELIEQLLDVARLETGELRLELDDHDLKPLLERLAASFGALARRRGVDFRAELPAGEVRARVDANRMETVWANLLANALKFTPEGGRVVLEVERTGGGGDGEREGRSEDGAAEERNDGGGPREPQHSETPAELVTTVRDGGPGIPEAELDRIFERFYQVGETTRRQHGGAGLGLALVRELVELHGGSVTVRSEPGQGSRFTVRLPVAGPMQPPVVSDVASTTPSPAGETGNETEQTVTTPSRPAEEPCTSPGSTDIADRPTVLVVEDHADLRAYLRRHLEDRYRVVEARHGKEALAEARREVPDLILCDIMMPEMDGEELCREIRADPELDFLPVIVVTARASRPSRLGVLDLGADDYLVKPFDPEELRLRVRNALASRRRLAERLRRERGELTFAPMELPRDEDDRDFAEELGTLLRARLDDEELDGASMAKAMAMSRATLYRKTKEALDTSPVELLWCFRLRQAAHWLEETDATVSEVAYACGFKTVPHFTRRFKDHFDMTPARYRRSH